MFELVWSAWLKKNDDLSIAIRWNNQNIFIPMGRTKWLVEKKVTPVTGPFRCIVILIASLIKKGVKFL